MAGKDGEAGSGGPPPLSARRLGRTGRGAGPAALWLAALLIFSWVCPPRAGAQAGNSRGNPSPPLPPLGAAAGRDSNGELEQLLDRSAELEMVSASGDYKIGPEDLLQVSVLEAPDLNRTVRVSAEGAISLPLLGGVQAAGLSPSGLEAVLEELLRRSYMKDPHVSIFVEKVRSHAVSVFGAVGKPGVYQIRSAKSLVEVLSMAQGLAANAGDAVLVTRQGGAAKATAGVSPAAAGGAAAKPEAVSGGPGWSLSDGEESASGQTVQVSLKDLLNSGDASANVLVYPGDVVRVTRAGIVYVVGEVRKPGGFVLNNNENISVLQALALAEGLTPTSAAKRSRIILASGTGSSRTQVAINLKKILAGKAPDPLLHSKDILFVPNSGGKSALHGFADSIAGISAAAGSAAVYRW